MAVKSDKRKLESCFLSLLGYSFNSVFSAAMFTSLSLFLKKWGSFAKTKKIEVKQRWEKMIWVESKMGSSDELSVFPEEQSTFSNCTECFLGTKIWKRFLVLKLGISKFTD